MNRDSTTTALLVGGLAIVAGGITVLRNVNSNSRTSSLASTSKSNSTSTSSITYEIKVLPEMCDFEGRAYGGELLKMLDVGCGLIAARFCNGPCLTISLDRVTFLQPVNVNDCLQISVAVNRSFGSSLEIGVKVTLLGEESTPSLFVIHAYFTFVKIRPIIPPPSFLTSIAQSLHILSPPKQSKAEVPELIPTTNLEKKRFLLAGRRRAHRLSSTTNSLLITFRAQLLEMEAAKKIRDLLNDEINNEEKDALLLSLQKELMVEAYMRKDDPDVKVDGEDLVAFIEGFVDEIRIPLIEIKKLAAAKGGYRRLHVPTVDPQDEIRLKNSNETLRTAEMETPIDLLDASSLSFWIVRPIHCNSKNILFGGQLIRFAEEVSSIAARKISSRCVWLTASIDSLTFKSQVFPGEVVYVRAYPINTYDSSVEIFTLVTAEDRNAIVPKRRLVSEAFFTLVAIDKVSGRPQRGMLRSVRLPDGAARQLAEGGLKRREERLQDKKILQRVYG